MSIVAWSYSRLSSYELCPKKYHEESVLKNYPFVKNEQAIYGDQVHKAFEDYFKKAKPLPLNLKHWTPTLAQFAKAPGEKLIEQQLAFNIEYEPVEWMAPDVWLRVKSDLTIVNQNKAIVMDWKTGKQREEDGTQLKLNAAVTFLLDPEITDIRMSYMWIQSKTVTPYSMNVSEVPDFWGSILPRVQRYQEAHDQNNFPPRPGFLCRGWCPVKTCSYYESRR